MDHVVHIAGFASLACIVEALRRDVDDWKPAATIAGLIAITLASLASLTGHIDQRILGPLVAIAVLIHAIVPAITVAFTLSVSNACLYLWSGRTRNHRAAVAAAEVGVVLAGLELVVSAIFSKPTWAVWWSGDWQQTALVIAVLGHLPVLLMDRTSMLQREWRRRLTGIAAVSGYATFVGGWFWARWCRQLCQVSTCGWGTATTPEAAGAISTSMIWGFVLLALGWIGHRASTPGTRGDTP